MSTYVVGDIQACYRPLRALLDQVGFEPGRDTLWAVGDLIGRGPQPVQTLQLFLSSEAYQSVLGNHDLHFLTIHAGLREAKVRDNFTPLLEHPERQKMAEWLRQCPLATQLLDGSLLSHAGLYPSWSIDECCTLANDVSAVLKSNKWQDLLANMYGNQPDKWDNALRGWERLRFIVNALTRMRFVDTEQRLDFACKLAPSQAPVHLSPWFSHTNSHLGSQQRVIFGHWAALQGQTGSTQFVGLDTGYVWGGPMSLFQVETGQLFLQGPLP